MTHAEIKEIIRECREKTRIEYGSAGSFFKPKLKSINHLEVGRSKIISSPLTIFIELLYQLKIEIRNAIQRIQKLAFPRPDQITGKAKDHRITGRITFEKKDLFAKPLHHISVAMWSRNWLLQWRKLGEALSDKNGIFELGYDHFEAKKWSTAIICLEIYQTTHYFTRNDRTFPHLELFKRIRISKSNLNFRVYSLEDIPLFLWEYREDFPTARVIIKDHDKDAPQYYSQARCDAASEQIIPFELTKVEHLAAIAVKSESISLASIQNDYPVNLTRCIESLMPGFTRSDEYFGHRLMNGMNRGAFLPDKDQPGHYWIKYFGACQYDSNRIYALPDAEIKLELRNDGMVVPIEIILTGPLNSNEMDPWLKRSYTTEDGENWTFAKRIARVVGGMSTEVDEHFAGTHLNAEQYAVAAYRNLRLNPVAAMLIPFLKEVVLINHSADKLLLRDFLPSATALTGKGLSQRVCDLLGVQDWKDFHPMNPISLVHDVARTDQLFWDITGKYVSEFFDRNGEEIRKQWYEIFCFSNDLVVNSVKVFGSDLDLKKADKNEIVQTKDRMEYYSFKYSFNSSMVRELKGHELKVLSPITKNDGSAEITPEDFQNLKDVCRYIIFVTTYLHTWINEHQYDEFGEVLYNCVGLRFGDGKNGVMAPESDLRIAPDLTRATQTLWFANLLSRTEFGFITRNEEGDVDPNFSRMLLDKKDEFHELGVNVHNIESRTNI